MSIELLGRFNKLVVIGDLHSGSFNEALEAKAGLYWVALFKVASAFLSLRSWFESKRETAVRNVCLFSLKAVSYKRMAFGCHLGSLNVVFK